MPRVPTKEVKQRTKAVTELFHSYAPYAGREGEVHAVLVTETASDGVHLVGHTKAYEQVLVPHDARLLGKVVTVTITRTGKFFMVGAVHPDSVPTAAAAAAGTAGSAATPPPPPQAALPSGREGMLARKKNKAEASTGAATPAATPPTAAAPTTTAAAAAAAPPKISLSPLTLVLAIVFVLLAIDLVNHNFAPHRGVAPAAG